MTPEPVYYHPREQLGPRIVLAVPVGIALGIVYALASGLVTEVFESAALFVVVTPLFGGLVAMASRWVADLAQVRSRTLRLALAVATSAIAMGAGWPAYRFFDGKSGVFLWLVQAAVVLAMVVYLLREVDIQVPFCEACHAWTKVVVSFELSHADASAAEERLRAGDAAALAAMRPRARDEDEYAVVRVYRCGCGVSRYVSLDRAQREAGTSAGIRTYHGIGHRPSLYFDPGTSASTDLTPVVTNLQIEGSTEKALAAASVALARQR